MEECLLLPCVSKALGPVLALHTQCILARA